MLTIGTLHIPSLILSVASWSSFYCLLRWLEPHRKAEWHCRLVTVVHAVLITTITVYGTFVEGPWPFTDAGGPSTPLQVRAVTICVGYFLFDLTWCLYFQTEGFAMLLHHSLSIFGMFFMLCSGQYGSEMVATIGGSEITNPLLQLRWFLRETGRYHTLAGEVVDVLFMTSFFFFRLILGSILLYCYFMQPTDIWGRMAGVVIYLIGWMFSISIVQYAIYKYGKKYKARKAASAQKDKSPLRSGVNSPGDNCGAKGDNCSSSSEFSSPVEGSSENGVHHRGDGVHSRVNGTSTRNGTVLQGSGGDCVPTESKKGL